MNKKFHTILQGISVLPALLVMPAMSEVIYDNITYSDAIVRNGQSEIRGGAFEFRDGATFESTATLTNNYTTSTATNYGLGGAIFADKDSDNNVVFTGAASFSGNNALAGGAIYNQQGLNNPDTAMIFLSDAIFSNNYSTSDGGAFVNQGKVVFNDDVTFDSNGKNGDTITTQAGGAVDNSGTMTFKSSATFTNNKSTNQGSSIHNTGTMTFEDGFTVSNNGSAAAYSGAMNSGALTVTGGDITISGNQAGRYAGFYNSAGTLDISGVGEIDFINNQSIGSSAGGLGLHENSVSATLSANIIKFDNNTSTGNGYGGAIFSAADLNILGTQNIFQNNESTTTSYASDKDETYYGGGAIHARAVDNDDTLVVGKNNSTNLFYNNSANEQGGALFARNGAEVIVNGTTTFDENSATKNGGAIYTRDNTSSIDITGTSVFTENTAGMSGGAIYNIGTMTLANATFGGTGLGNVADANGGAIFNNGTLELNNATFTGNSVTGEETFTINGYVYGGQGGAIFNGGGGDITVKGTSAFNNNTASSSGGAIDNLHSTITFDKAATFTGNSVSGGDGQGGAVRNKSGTISFNNGVNFTGNTSPVSGSALYNGINYLTGGVINITGNSTFQSNTGNYAIHNVLNNSTESHDLIAFSNGNATFSGNTGGALWNQDVVTFTNMGTVLFQGNTITQDSGSAIINVGSMTINANTFTVTGNRYNGTNKLGAAVGNTSPSSVFDLTATNVNFTNNIGGAIYKENDSFTITASNKINFSGNTGANAAAINNNGNYSQTTLNGGEIVFNSNIDSASYGGAIFNSGDYVKVLGDTVTFTSNQANGTTSTAANIVKYGGGAIQNRGNSASHQVTEIVVGKNANSIVTFENNTSAMNGGAIHARAEGTSDAGVVTINGTSTFQSNTAQLNGGAISNSPVSGTSTITLNGDATFSENTSVNGLGGAIYNTGALTLNDNATFADNTDSTGANDIYNDGVINFNGDVSLNGGITGNGTINIAENTTFDISEASIVQDSIVLDGTMLATLGGNNNQITTDSFSGDGLLKLSFSRAGTYDVFGNAEFDNVDITSSVYDTVLDGGIITATAKSAETIVANNAGLSSDTGKMIVALANSDNDTANQIGLKIQEALENNDAKYVEQEVAKMNPVKAPVTTAVALSTQNQVLAAAGERMALPLTGRNGGDTDADFGVWVKGMYNHTKHKDIFTGNTWGASVGFDTDLNHSVILGVGYSFANTDVDLDMYDVDINSNTVFVYGQYRNSDWFVNGTIGYTMSKYKWDNSVFGINVHPSYKVNSLSEQIMGGYHFENGVTPTVGLRYLDIHQDSYKNGIVAIDAANTKYLTAIAGMDYKYTWIAPHTSLFWNPELHLAATYDMVSDSDTALVMVPGAAAYTVHTDNLSRMGGEIGVGVSAEYYYLTVSLNYDLTIHKNFSSQTGSLKVKYKF